MLQLDFTDGGQFGLEERWGFLLKKCMLEVSRFRRISYTQIHCSWKRTSEIGEIMKKELFKIKKL